MLGGIIGALRGIPFLGDFVDDPSAALALLGVSDPADLIVDLGAQVWLSFFGPFHVQVRVMMLDTVNTLGKWWNAINHPKRQNNLEFGERSNQNSAHF